MKRASSLTALAFAVLASAEAHAYVRSRTTHGVPTAWAASCVFVQPDSAGTADLDASVLFPAMQRSLDNWNQATDSCAYLKLDYVMPAPLEVKLDGINTVKFVTSNWKYANVAAGITTIFYVDRPGQSDDGRLLDADVELNDVDFTFDILSDLGTESRMPRPGTTISDVENTLTHELGHVQGLDHTCKDSATPPTEVDDTGNPPVACDMVNSLHPAEKLKIKEATMYPTAAPDETTKRTPAADDIAGICAIYPKDKDPGRCAPADVSGYTGGCDMAKGAANPFFLGILLLAFVVLLQRQRQAR